MARHVDAYFDEWKATHRRPRQAGPLRVLRQRARRARTRSITFREERGQIAAGRRRPGRARRHDPGRSARSDGARSAGSTRSRCEGGVAALVDGAAVAIFRTHDGNVYAMSNYDPSARASVLARGIVGTRGDVPFVASPMHKQAFDLRTGQCLDDAAVRVPTYDVRVDDGLVLRRPTAGDVARDAHLPLSGFRVGVTAARKVEEQIGLLERRGAAVEWAPALSLDPNQIDDVAAAGGDRGGAEPAGRHVPGDDRHRHEVVVRGRRAVGAAATTCWRHWARPRSWRAARRASVRCGGTGCASCGRRSRSASRTCWSTCAAARSTGLRIVVQEHGQSLSMVAHALRRQGADVTTVTVYRVEAAADLEPMFKLVDLIADRALDAVTFTSAPAVAALMEAAGPTGPPRRADRRVPGRRGRVLRRAGDRRRVRDVGRADDLSRSGPAWPRWSSSSSSSCRRGARGSTLELVGGHQLLLHGDDVLLDGARGRAVAGAGCRAAGAASPTPATSSPGRRCSRCCRRAPPGRSTRSRWRSPGCAPRSAPGPCRPWSSAATGWRWRP